MQQSRTKLEDSKFEAERRHKYRGTVRIALEAIHLPEEPDQRRVERLKGIFRKERCRPEHNGNHVLLLIDEPCLGAALSLSGLSSTALLQNRHTEYPELRLSSGHQLVCLHGKHRIQAGREYLPVRDKWWVADLYLADISHGVQQLLIEDYSNEAPRTDGEIYCKIRQYHFQRNLSFEMHWWARLRGNRAQNLKSILRHDQIRAAFDALLDMPGQWNGMQLTTIHKMMALKFDEGILNSLDHIRGFWHDLLDGEIDAMRKVDEPTVKALELRSPGSSTFDAEMIQRQIRGAEIFSAFSEHDRLQILGRLRQFKGLIPSLHAFFRNLCYWEACVDSIRHLVTPSRGDTIFTALESHFTGINQQEGQVLIQVDESNFTVTAGSMADQVEFGRRHIVAFAMRHFVEIPRAPVREDVLGKARAKADRVVLRQYAELAIRLGFESPEIVELMKNPSTAVAETIELPIIPPLVTSGHGEDVKQRCGLPRLAAFGEDRDSLFVHYLDNERDACGEGITSFFVRRWVYVDFLGRPRGTVALAPTERVQEARERAQQNQVQVQEEHEAREEQEREPQAQREREEREQREREAQEREAQEREAQEREAQEREAQEREAQEREAQEWEAQEREAQEREVQEREERERREREAQEGEEQGQREWEEREQRENEERELVCIHFKIRERNDWRNAQSLWIDRSDPSEVARVAKKSMRKGLRIFDTNMRLLGPDDCFEVVTADGTNTILLVPQTALDIDDRLLDSASILSYSAIVDSVRNTRPRRD